MEKTIVITCYHSLKDPIVDGLLLKYLITINEKCRFSFLLITFEQPHYRLSEEEVQKTKEVLDSQNILWVPLTYRTGGFLIVFKKLLNFLSLLMVVLRHSFKRKIAAFMGFTSLSGALAFLLAKLFRKSFFIYCFEPHSYYQLDFGIWESTSLSYKILNYLERMQVRNAEHIVVPTEASRKLVTDWGASGRLHVMPVSVDEKQFYIDNLARRETREELGIHDSKTVILYLGKFGGIYYSVKEVMVFFKALSKQKNLVFLLITPNGVGEIKKELSKAGLSLDRVRIKGVIPIDELVRYLNASDIGFLAVPGLPSQKFRTPIKTANYLLSGLPYIVNAGVAEDDLIAQKEGVGFVLNQISVEEAEKLIPKIMALETRDSLALKCREVGLRYRRLNNSTDLLQQIFTELINK